MSQAVMGLPRRVTTWGIDTASIASAGLPNLCVTAPSHRRLINITSYFDICVIRSNHKELKRRMFVCFHASTLVMGGLKRRDSRERALRQQARWARPTVSRTGRPRGGRAGGECRRVEVGYDGGWPAPTGVVTGRVVAAAESFIVEASGLGLRGVGYASRLMRDEPPQGPDQVVPV